MAFDCIKEVIRSFPVSNNEPTFDIGGGNGYVETVLLLQKLHGHPDERVFSE